MGGKAVMLGMKNRLMMNTQVIRKKFGNDFIADEHTFKLGIDRRFTKHFADRFRSRRVLETCTGAGFTTISLARVATHVTTVEIDPSHQAQAKENVKRAGLIDYVTFISGDILDKNTLMKLPPIDAAFLDPDWADTEPDHEYFFIDSNTQPPADILFEKIYGITQNIALVLPPYIDIREFEGLPDNERERLYLGESHELYCLYFGEFVSTVGETEFRVPI
jgi:SAM-dependent methyltransferase